ncbi:MAG: RNA methyltransferase [Rhodothermales bacterium]|nr:RNA methyltransferase [Rhodothermales bacterium]
MNLDRSPGEAKLSNRRRAEYRSLQRGKGRRELGQYLIEGVRAMESAVAAGVPLIDMVVGAETAVDPRVARLIEAVDCPVLEASSRDLEAIGNARSSQGIAAAAQLPETNQAVTFPCLVLDGIQDPGNVGTLIRTAAWFGIKTVLCGPGTADPYQPKVVRSSQGGLWDVSVVCHSAIPAVLAAIAAVPVYVADLNGNAAASWGPEDASALVIGSEAHGPSDELRERADGAVTIQGVAPSGTESLNAAVAGGILLHRWLGE